MDTMGKVKEWINENAPMLSRVYENKYIGMLYDRFASLPAKKQRQTLLGVLFGIIAIVAGYLLLSYVSLWSTTDKTNESYAMVSMLQQFQKQRRDKSQQIRSLSHNAELAGPGQLKTHLIQIGRAASISPRMMDAEEKEDNSDAEEGKGTSEVKMKQATVTLNRVNLTQLVAYIKGVEFGNYGLSISSLKITNDDKIRGYMKAELGIVAYLFEPEES